MTGHREVVMSVSDPGLAKEAHILSCSGDCPARRETGTSHAVRRSLLADIAPSCAARCLATSSHAADNRRSLNSSVWSLAMIACRLSRAASCKQSNVVLSSILPDPSKVNPGSTVGRSLHARYPSCVPAVHGDGVPPRVYPKIRWASSYGSLRNTRCHHLVRPSGQAIGNRLW